MAAYASGSLSSSTAGRSQPGAAGSVQEFSIRVPKNNNKKYQVMRFNASLGVDFKEWKTQSTQIKMERENNLREFRGTEEEIPKFGAGSEFGKEAKEEARRKKFGVISKKYRPDDQPWILKIGGKAGKKFKGIREGGVSDNTAYYVFTQAGKGVIEAYPLQEWYKFQPIQRYKALSAEEAEEEFGRRNKIINYFSVMVKKRLKPEDDGDAEELEEGGKGKKGGGKKGDKKELKISEMDDWVDSDEDLSGSDDDGKKDDEDEEEKGKKGKKGKGKGKGKAAAKKKKKDSDDEAVEESDDGDEEGRELDYISDSSESASDHEMKANKELKGVAEEDALRKLLNSESEDEDENEEKKKDENASNSDDDEKKKKDGGSKDKNDKNEDGSDKKKKKDLKKKKKPEVKKANGKKTEGADDSSSELSPNSTDSDSDAPTDKKSNPKPKAPANSAGSSRSTTPTLVAGEKRKLTNAESAVAAAKKAKLDTGTSSTYLPSSSESVVTEDSVRRYLMRKPMTTIELLHKFKSKKTGLSSEQLVNLMTQILKNINPVKQTIKNKMYLSIKPTPQSK